NARPVKMVPSCRASFAIAMFIGRVIRSQPTQPASSLITVTAGVTDGQYRTVRRTPRAFCCGRNVEVRLRYLRIRRRAGPGTRRTLMADKLITVATYTSSIDAALARNRLEAEGIPAFLDNEESSSVWGGLIGTTLIKLMVPEEDVLRADDI